MIEMLLEMADGRLVIPLIVIAAGIALGKWAFHLSRSRSQDRRDFLDLMRGNELQTDLWISVAVRHAFGAYLPATLIRQLMSSPQPGRALAEVASAWDFLEMDDETGELGWRRRLWRSGKNRKVAITGLAILYFLLAATFLLIGYICVTGGLEEKELWIAWSYAILSAFGAVSCLSYGENMKTAERTARRWLGVT